MFIAMPPLETPLPLGVLSTMQRQGLVPLSSIAQPFPSLLHVMSMHIGLMVPIVDRHGRAVHKANPIGVIHFFTTLSQVDLTNISWMNMYIQLVDRLPQRAGLQMRSAHQNELLRSA